MLNQCTWYSKYKSWTLPTIGTCIVVLNTPWLKSSRKHIVLKTRQCVNSSHTGVEIPEYRGNLHLQYSCEIYNNSKIHNTAYYVVCAWPGSEFNQSRW